MGVDGFDDQFVDLLDATMVEATPGNERLAILAERGWTRLERVPADRLDTQPDPTEQHSPAGAAVAEQSALNPFEITFDGRLAVFPSTRVAPLVRQT